MRLEGYAWRKYELGVPVCRWVCGDPYPPPSALVLWPACDGSHLPKLNRWEGLGPAFAGFMSHGMRPPFACAYYADKVYELIRAKLYQSWVGGADAAEAYEYVLANLLGVWMGEKTPYLISTSQDLSEIVKVSDC